MASKEDIKALEDRVSARFGGIESRLGRIENFLLAKQEQRLNALEARLKNLKTPSLSSMSSEVGTSHAHSRQTHMAAVVFFSLADRARGDTARISSHHGKNYPPHLIRPAPALGTGRTSG
jgi:hypothetical protein